jgi:hypothetical protein
MAIPSCRLNDSRSDVGADIALRGWVVGIKALHGNPYDGHTLKAAHAQVEQLTGVKPTELFVDRGYRGAQHHPADTQVYLSGRELSGTLKRLLRRRGGDRARDRTLETRPPDETKLLEGSGGRSDQCLVGRQRLQPFNLRRVNRCTVYVFSSLSMRVWCSGQSSIKFL